MLIFKIWLDKGILSKSIFLINYQENSSINFWCPKHLTMLTEYLNQVWGVTL